MEVIYINAKKNVEIRMFTPIKEYKSLDLEDKPRVEKIIRDYVLPQSKGEYCLVNVRIKRDKDKKHQYLIAYMMRKDIYLVEVVKVDLDNNFKKQNIIFNYDDSKDRKEEEEDFRANEDSEYKEEYDFIASTPIPDKSSTAHAAVEYLHTQAIHAGLKSKKLLGNEATIANYKQYLTCGLKGFVNIGHGNADLIALYDGTLDYNWFKHVSNGALNNEIVYFNSCRVFNNPLKDAVMNAGTRTFIGGIVDLKVGSSEQVCKHFWDKILSTQIHMDAALHQSEQETSYPDLSAHGIAGDTGSFKTSGLVAESVKATSEYTSTV